jgi:hypothetical protein
MVTGSEIEAVSGRRSCREMTRFAGASGGAPTWPTRVEKPPMVTTSPGGSHRLSTVPGSSRSWLQRIPMVPSNPPMVCVSGNCLLL